MPLVKCLPGKQTFDGKLHNAASGPWLVDEQTAAQLEGWGIVERVGVPEPKPETTRGPKRKRWRK